MLGSPNLCPELVRRSLEFYAREGRPLGGFLTAVVSNDLIDAVRRADPINTANLADIVAYVEYRLPGACRGSRAVVAEWLRAHRRLVLTGNRTATTGEDR